MIETSHQKNLTETVKVLNESNKITDLLHTNIVKIYELNTKALHAVIDVNDNKVNTTIIGIILIIVVSMIIGIVFATIMSKIFSDKAH
jgi:hypothetical protein